MPVPCVLGAGNAMVKAKSAPALSDSQSSAQSTLHTNGGEHGDGERVDRGPRLGYGAWLYQLPGKLTLDS